MFGLGPDHLFFSTCNGVQPFVGGRWQPPVVDDAAYVAGIDGSRLWAFRGRQVYRYDGDRFVPDDSFPSLGDGGDYRELYGVYRLPAAHDADSVYIGIVDHDFNNRIAQHIEDGWRVLPLLPGGTPGVMYERPYYKDFLAEDGHLWVVGSERTRPTRTVTRVWKWDGHAWTNDDLRHPRTQQWSRFLAGRDGELWVVSPERIIWRRQVDGTWERDDRCVDSPHLWGIQFDGAWFPPDGGPPKVFGSHGNVLVYDELL